MSFKTALFLREVFINLLVWALKGYSQKDTKYI